MAVTRNLHQADALTWLSALPGAVAEASFVTSLPDISEFSSFSVDQWKTWFISAAQLVLSRCPDDGVVIFYQSDIKRDGVWIDKGYLCMKAAELSGGGVELIAHKIICRSPPVTVRFGRAAYSHLLCFSRGVRPLISKSSCDVLPSAGASTWTRGMGIDACRLACQFVRAHTASSVIVDPFCGHGALLVVAEEMGFNTVGVDRSAKCIRKAESLTMADLV